MQGDGTTDYMTHLCPSCVYVPQGSGDGDMCNVMAFQGISPFALSGPGGEDPQPRPYNPCAIRYVLASLTEIK